jgi:hypothetical protein
LLSLHISAAGASEGFSIAGLIGAIRTGLVSDVQRGEAFEALLREGVGYREAQAAHYLDQAILRAPARLIPIDDRFPRMVRSLLDPLPAEARARIDEVRYRINVEGMGVEDGDSRFIELVP